MADHARKSPSGSERWMACPGSINLCDQVPTPEPSEYAKEGTAAHLVGSECLEEGTDADSRLGDVIHVEGSDFIVDEEMADAVQVYLDAIRADKKSGYEMSVEKRFDLSWLSADMFGTNDCCLFNKKEQVLRIYDYKHGQGTFVEVEWNPQLMIYALGALYEAWDFDDLLPVTHTVKMVEMVIVQPRMESEDGPVRRWMISTEELLYWALNVLKPAALRTEDPNAPLMAGAHCKYCDAQAVCPEKAEAVSALAKTEFNNPVLPAPKDLTGEDIAAIMSKAGMFDKWLKSVMAYAYEMANVGTPIPGYKLVKKKSNRKWVGDIAEAKLIGLLGDAAYAPQTIISPAQAEKILKKLGKSPEAELDGLWEKPEKGLTLAPVDDKRPEVMAPAAADFIENEDFLD